ncbi:MAG: hypothetical protein Q8N23_37050 [Archangium sp.]|nr:hypothetical protein [Archangium sp.]MDP3158341.1 hypothetical protein [Archangium sp.]MDP3569568.1 hypothetical protein [Archangium sp.]
MKPLEAAWEAVLGSPDDDGALQVLSDALMERGDPHGELIRLQLASDEDGAHQHLATHAAELLGDPLHLTTWLPRFTRGFLSSVVVAEVRELEAVIDRPVGRLLRQLEVNPLTIEPIVEVLSQRGPRTISSLRFGSASQLPGVLEVAPVTARLSALQHLVLGSWALRFDGASSRSLRTLSINLQNPARGLDEARFPRLEALALELPFRRLDLPLALLAGDVAPSLQSLSITGALWPQQLSDLSVSALLRGLKRLEIAAEAETGWYTTLIETIDSFAHLERLELVADRHHPEWVQAVKAALPQATIREPRLRL